MPFQVVRGACAAATRASDPQTAPHPMTRAIVSDFIASKYRQAGWPRKLGECVVGSPDRHDRTQKPSLRSAGLERATAWQAQRTQRKAVFLSGLRGLCVPV